MFLMDKILKFLSLGRSGYRLFLFGAMAILLLFFLAFYIRYQLNRQQLIEQFTVAVDKLDARARLVDRLLEQRLFLLENSSAMQRVINDPSELATVGLLSEWSKFSRNFRFQDRLYYVTREGDVVLQLEHDHDQPVISWGEKRRSVLSHYFASIGWAMPGKVYQHQIGIGENGRYLLYLAVFDKWANLHGFIVQEFAQKDLDMLVNGLASSDIGPYLMILQDQDWNSFGVKKSEAVARLHSLMDLGKDEIPNYNSVEQWLTSQVKIGYEVHAGHGFLLKQSLSGILNNKPVILLFYMTTAELIGLMSAWIFSWILSLLFSLVAMGVIAYLWHNRQVQIGKILHEQALRLAAFEGGFSQLVLDEIGRVIAVNAFHCQQVGMRREDLLGLRADAFMGCMDPGFDKIMELARANSGWRGEVNWSNAKGEPHCMLATVTILNAEAGLKESCIFSGVDLSAQKKLEVKLQELADTDPLTGCFNRRAFEQALARELSRCKRSGNTFSLLLLDVDHFKAINDNYGHDIGDRVLIELVNLLRSHIRSADILARWGGEEFVLLLPDTMGVQAMLLAERLRQAVASKSDQPGFTVSLGVAESQLQINSDQLFVMTDKALYKAKSSGRNRVVLADPIELDPVAQKEDHD